MQLHTAVPGLAPTPYGLVLRREALAAGLDDKDLRRLMRTGELVRIRHGAYALGSVWGSSTEAEQLAIRTHAVMRSHHASFAASHHSACSLHGMDLWDIDFTRAHLTHLGGGRGRVGGDVSVHEGLCEDEDVSETQGLRTVIPARAALESASLSGVERGLVTVDSGLRVGLFDRAQLRLALRSMAQWPNSRHLDLVVQLADGRSESVGETRSRYLFWSQGLPRPVLQFRVEARGQLVGITDFAWPGLRLLGEFDGRVKYARYLRPGENPGDAVFREKRREDRLREVTGWSVVRLTWADLHEPARTASRIRAMVARSIESA